MRATDPQCSAPGGSFCSAGGTFPQEPGVNSILMPTRFDVSSASFMSSLHDNLLRADAFETVGAAGATAEVRVVASAFVAVVLLLEQATNPRQADANSATCMRVMAGPYAS